MRCATPCRSDTARGRPDSAPGSLEVGRDEAGRRAMNRYRRLICRGLTAGVLAGAAPARLAAPAIVHASGRIGDDDPLEVETLRQTHNLQVVFALKGSGAYLADVTVSIQTPAGQELLGTQSPGPFFFAPSPPAATWARRNSTARR